MNNQKSPQQQHFILKNHLIQFLLVNHDLNFGDTSPFVRVLILTNDGYYYDFAIEPDPEKTNQPIEVLFKGIDETFAERILDEFLVDLSNHIQKLNSPQSTH